MKKWLNLWPLLGLPLVWVCNVDANVIPMLRYLFPFWLTVVLSITIATAELIYIFWLIGKMEKLIKERAKEKVKAEDVRFAESIIDRIRNYSLNKYGALVEMLKETVFPVLKRGGYLAIFAAGIIPEPGFRVGGSIFCQLINSRRGFTILLMGNAIKTGLMVKFWETLHALPLWIRFLIVFSTLIILGLVFKIMLHKKRAA